MSLSFPQRPISSLKQAPRIAIIASQYNAPFVDAMLEQAQQEIKAIEPKTEIEIIRVQGAFEIPLLAKIVAERRRPDVIIALGVIIKGETAHGDLISSAISNALMQLSLDEILPVIHEVLLLNNEEQAITRCLTESVNCGTEAVRAAFVALHAISTLHQR